MVVLWRFSYGLPRDTPAPTTVVDDTNMAHTHVSHARHRHRTDHVLDHDRLARGECRPCDHISVGAAPRVVALRVREGVRSLRTVEGGRPTRRRDPRSARSVAP